MKENRTIGEAFKICQKAETILRDLLPAEWLFREQKPDFHIDFVIEVVKRDELTGINFGVQLKGTSPKKGREGQLNHQLKIKPYRYYVEKSEYPIFLILLDVVNRKGYWCFIQGFAKEPMRRERWQNRRTITIPFARENCLDDLPRFEKAILEAAQYMKDLRPGSIKAAVEAKKAALQKLDPRVDVDINFKDGTPHFTLKANQKFDFSMAITHRADDQDMQRAVSNFIEKGEAIRIPTTALKVEGMPIISEELLKDQTEGYVVMQVSRDVPGLAQIFEGPTASDFLMQIEGKFVVGGKFATFFGQLPNSALSLSAEIPVRAPVHPDGYDMKIRLDASKWINQALLQLSHFDATRRFLYALHFGKRVVVRFQVQGNSLGDVELQRPVVEDVLGMLELLHRARHIASRYRLNVILPGPGAVLPNQWALVEIVYKFLTTGKATIFRPELQITKELAGPVPAVGTRIYGKSFQIEGQILRLFGKEFDLGPHRNTVSELVVESAVPGAGGSTKLTLSSTDQTVMMLEKLEGEPVAG